MSARAYALLGFGGFVVAVSIALLQRSPGYMDADYYYAGGLRLAGGHGFSEQTLWNYLDDPVGLPHPSHAYWMPLASLLAAGGMALLGRPDFAAARLLFILAAALIPPLAAALAWRLGGRKSLALLAGVLALLSGFYLPYMATTDTFAPYMLLGALFFLLLPGPRETGGEAHPRAWIRFAGLGLIAGLMHLARADGLIWLLTALAAGWLCWRAQKRRGKPGRVWAFLLAGAAGYLLVMLPWFARNLSVFGVLLSPGGGRALWIRSYDELFFFPASQLTPARWLGAGFGEILRVRLWAAGQNLLSALAVQGEVFLLPLILIGMWKLRADLRVQLAGLAWALTFLMMSVPFPFQGARGGFFHSGAALQPFFWAVAPIGFERLIEFGSGLRGWRAAQARRVFGAGLIVMAACFSLFLAYERVLSAGPDNEAWDRSYMRYQGVESYLLQRGAGAEEAVMVNNAPGYFVASGRSAISIPYGDLQAVCAAARQHRAAYLLLEIDQIRGGSELFDAPHDRLCLKYLGAPDGIRVYRTVEK